MTHEEGLTVIGRRSTKLNIALDVRFTVVECYFFDLSTSTTLPTSLLMDAEVGT